MREGRHPRAVAQVQEIPDLLPRDPLRLISAWSLAILATILVVDDRPENRQLLTTLLGYQGHRLREAADGSGALETVRFGH